MKLIVGEFDHTPPFMAFEPLFGRAILAAAGLAACFLAISFGLI
jgi:hypothetical protein